MKEIVLNEEYPFHYFIELIEKEYPNGNIQKLVCQQIKISEKMYNDLYSTNEKISESNLLWEQIKTLCDLAGGFSNVLGFDASGISEDFIKICLFKIERRRKKS